MYCVMYACYKEVIECFIDVYKRQVYIPAFVTHTNVEDLVYNDFYIGEGADVVVVAGCGIHNDGHSHSMHNGIHRFFVGKDAKVVYLEKHIGTGEGDGKRIINPVTHCEIEEGGYMKMDTTQLRGVDSTVRKSSAKLKAGATVSYTHLRIRRIP